MMAIQTLSSFALGGEREPLRRLRALRSVHHTNEIGSHRGTEPYHPVKSTTRAKLPILHMEGMKDWERWLRGHHESSPGVWPALDPIVSRIVSQVRC